MTDIRDSVVLGAGSLNPLIFEMLIDELKTCGIMREVCEKKIETNLRRRRRKDLLRLQILRMIEVAVFRGLLRVSMIDSNGALNPTIADFIDCMRVNLENDNDRDIAIVTQLRLHLAKIDGPSDVLRSVSVSLRSGSSRASVPNSLSQFLSKICTILRWENMTDIRDSVVLGAGSLNPLIFEMLIDELKTCGIMREVFEKKIETNLRRRRRKDLLRLQILRMIEVAVFRGLLRVSMIDSNGALNPTIADFIDCMRVNLENDNDRDIAIVTQLRLHLAKLVALIIDSTPTHARNNLFTVEKRSSFFYLFMAWCSKAIAADRKCRDKEVGSYVEQKSVIAMTRVLCCGQVLEPNKSIGEEGFLCGWLEKLVISNNPTIQSEVEGMLACMLELNESNNLLDWVMAQCYSQSSTVSTRCFRALVHVFSRRDFPCEFVSLFVLCQAMLAVPEVANCAVLLIEILKKQFLNNSVAVNTTSPTVSLRSPNEVVGTTFCSHSIPIDQHEICSRLAKAYPHLTVTIFSEVSYRLESSSWSCRVHLLALLQPWISNLELVDKNLIDEALEGPRGWGSEEATQLVLNNLLHLTATLSADHEREMIRSDPLNCANWQKLGCLLMRENHAEKATECLTAASQLDRTTPLLPFSVIPLMFPTSF